VSSAPVLRLAALESAPLVRLLERFGLALEWVGEGEAIPGSYWGDSEAGLRGATLYARPDTPLHSLLHETAHYLCMSPARRAVLERDAGGDDLEEAAVCYLQLVLAEQLPGTGREQLSRDMDAWGYSFRLGSTLAWWREDAGDARGWLIAHGLIDPAGELTGARAGERGAVRRAVPSDGRVLCHTDGASD
jgi:hypothetical protein